jgi:prophage regulatory protein
MVQRILREPEVKARTGLSKTTRWRLERAGDFPVRIPISANASGWLESEVESWIRARAEEREPRPERMEAVGTGP